MMIKLMTRFPIVVTFGACLIGWVGGETIMSDVALREFSEANPWLHYAAAAAGALAVLAIGKFFQKKTEAPPESEA
jgi:predicted tellurium resistance membrane protein TerC